MTRTRTSIALVAVAAVAVFVAAFVAVRLAGPAGQPAPLPGAAARTQFPGLQPAASEPQLPGLAALRPAAGTVQQVPGPFDDRFVLEHLALDSSGVQGTARITSDVSDILEFEVLAGFYDERGQLLGTNRFVYHLNEDAHSEQEHSGPPSELERFSVPVPAGLSGSPVSAAVGVPVLVNE